MLLLAEPTPRLNPQFVPTLNPSKELLLIHGMNCGMVNENPRAPSPVEAVIPLSRVFNDPASSETRTGRNLSTNRLRRSQYHPTLEVRDHRAVLAFLPRVFLLLRPSTFLSMGETTPILGCSIVPDGHLQARNH